MQKRLKVKKTHLNKKAFATLTVTLCIFSLILLPVVVLQINIATNDYSKQSFNNLVLETLICVSFSVAYLVLPLMTALGDKEVKMTIAKWLKSRCDEADPGVYPAITKI